MIQKFLTMLVVLMMLIPSVIAAPNENANPKADLKIVDQSKGTMKEIKDDKVKGVKSSSSDIIVEDKGKNSIKLKDSKPSKDDKEHKKVKVSIPSSELQEIDVDKDGKFGILETADGIVISKRTATSAQLAAGIDLTFSEVEVNGFSGYREETFASRGSGTLNTVDVSGDYVRTISVDGTVPNYVPGIPTSGRVLYAPLMQNLSDVSGNNLHLTASGTGSSGYDATNGLLSNGTRIFTSPSSSLFNSSNFTMAVKYTYRAGDVLSSSQYIKITGKTNIGYSSPSVTTYYDIFNTNGRLYRDRNYLSYTQPNSLVISGTSLPDTTTYFYHNLASYTIAASGYNPISNANQLVVGSTDGYYRDAVWYNRKLSANEVMQYYAGASGISVKPTESSAFTPYNVASGTEKIISAGGTSNTVDYIDTTGGTRNVTVRTYYTEDTTVSTETSTDEFYNASVAFSPSVALTNGTIVRPIAPLYTGIAVLDSNNSNAVMVQNRTHYTIYTGTLTAGSWAGYNVSVPNNADHGMWLNRLMQWVSGVGWNFVGDAPADYTDDLSDEITVTVS